MKKTYNEDGITKILLGDKPI
jgi:dynein heavy chain, axonemal